MSPGIMIRYLLLLFPAFLLTGKSFSQITSSAADEIMTTQYSVQPAQDSIFVFCPGPGGIEKTGTLTATPQSDPPGWDFVWSKLDTVSFTFSDIASVSGVPSSTVNNLGTGYYRVRITNGAAVTNTYYAWVYVRHMDVTASLVNMTCYQLAFGGEINADLMKYFDPGDQSRIRLNNPVSYQWTASPDYFIPWSTSRLQIVIETEPPSVDTDFFLTAADAAGCSQQGNFFMETIYPRADFEINYELDDNNRPSAPLDVFLTNNSENAVEYRWFFDDGTDTVSVSILDPAKHTYYIKEDCKSDISVPCEYFIRLHAISEEGCMDSTTVSLEVAGSELKIPNVFTPDEDGTNDRFYVDHVSLRFLHVLVFNRNGRKVYEFVGDEHNLRDWQGWDGKILNTGQDASPGIYYYVISAFGWDDLKYQGKKYRGTVYIFREK